MSCKCRCSCHQTEKKKLLWKRLCEVDREDDGTIDMRSVAKEAIRAVEEIFKDWMRRPSEEQYEFTDYLKRELLGEER